MTRKTAVIKIKANITAEDEHQWWERLAATRECAERAVAALPFATSVDSMTDTVDTREKP